MGRIKSHGSIQLQGVEQYTPVRWQEWHMDIVKGHSHRDGGIVAAMFAGHRFVPTLATRKPDVSGPSGPAWVGDANVRK